MLASFPAAFLALNFIIRVTDSTAKLPDSDLCHSCPRSGSLITGQRTDYGLFQQKLDGDLLNPFTATEILQASRGCNPSNSRPSMFFNLQD